jgi:hypothetical protein
MQSLFALSVKFSQLSASKYTCVTSQRSQLTMSGTSCHDNGTDVIEEEIIHVGLGGVSNNFVWENIDSFPTSRETFCKVHGPQFDTVELDAVSVFDFPCTANCRWNQQVCSAGNIEKHQTSHILL